jgi:hypothetical protein
MEKIMDVFRRNDSKKRIPVLRIEIDYYLLCLHDAILDEDLKEMDHCKKRLEQLSKEMLLLEAYTVAK